MHAFLRFIKEYFSNVTAIMFVAIALLVWIIDGNKYKNKNYKKELSLVKFFSYFYIAFGIIVFILLRLV